MNLGQEEGGLQEGLTTLNLEVGPHTRLSPNSIPLRSKSPGSAPFPLTGHGWGAGEMGAGSGPDAD